MGHFWVILGQIDEIFGSVGHQGHFLWPSCNTDTNMYICSYKLTGQQPQHVCNVCYTQYPRWLR